MTMLDITEQALSTQSATLKIDYLEKARTFENKHFMILSVKMAAETGHQVILKTKKNKKPTILFNLNKAPFRIKISHEFAESWRIKQQAKRDLKACWDKEILEPLFNKSFEQSMENETNGKEPYWVSMELYWTGYARGVREHRQKVKATAQSAIDIIGADDVAELSHELGISEDKLTYAVMEVISKRNSGGKE